MWRWTDSSSVLSFHLGVRGCQGYCKSCGLIPPITDVLFDFSTVSVATLLLIGQSSLSHLTQLEFSLFVHQSIEEKFKGLSYHMSASVRPRGLWARNICDSEAVLIAFCHW